MVISGILRLAAKRLAPVSQTPALDARVLLAFAANAKDAALLIREPSSAELARFERFLTRRLSGEPIAYILGEKEFMSLPFYVDKNVLIPRPDTEILVEKSLALFSGRAPRILDLCCGTGCVGISLAHYLKGASAVLADISGGALAVAKKNIARHGLGQRVKTRKLNVLKEPLGEGFDLITANPPYIRSGELETLEVARHEPRLALDGGGDGLIFYRAIAQKAPAALRQSGVLALEIGFDQAEQASGILSKAFRSVTLVRDYAGNDRALCCENPLAQCPL